MDVKPGYKLTEVGIIPDGWRVEHLGEIANIKTGSRNNEDKIEDGEYPFFVRSEVVERINSYSHDCEAILIPGEGRIGSIFHHINGRFDVHQRVYAITRFRSDLDARYLHRFLSRSFGPWAMQNTVKATVDSLRLPTFQGFRVALPPLPEQRAIAATWMHCCAGWTGLSSRSATSSRPLCSSCSPARAASRASTGSGR